MKNRERKAVKNWGEHNLGEVIAMSGKEFEPNEWKVKIAYDAFKDGEIGEASQFTFRIEGDDVEVISMFEVAEIEGSYDDLVAWVASDE